MLRKVTELASAIAGGVTEQELLRTLVSHDATVATKDDDFLSETKLCGDKVDGGVCVQLLNECLKGDASGCVAAWGNLGWSAGLDWKTMDHGAASTLARKLELDKKTVEEVLKAVSAPGGTPSETLKMALQGIKNRISPSSVNVRPIAVASKVPGVSARVGVVLMAGGGLIGGGNNASYANYVRKIDALKLNLSMNGGGQHTAAMVRSSLAELNQLLTKDSKQIDQSDLVRINDAIDSLERSEQRVGKAQEYISLLTQALKESRVAKESLGTTVTLKVIGELAEKEKQSRSAVSKKAFSLTELLASLQATLPRIEAALALKEATATLAAKSS